MNRFVADQQILVNVAATLRASFADQDGEIAAPGGTVTVRVVNAAGTVLTAAGATTNALNVYSYSQAAVTATDRLTCTWTSSAGPVTTTTVEVVGGYYSTIATMRASDPSMVDTQKFSSARLLGARRFVEDEFEQYCNRAFIPRFATAIIRSPGSQDLVFPHPDIRSVRTATCDGVAVDLAQIILPSPSGVVRLDGICWPLGDISVGYEHGLNRPPAPIVRAFHTRVRNVVASLNSAVPDRATTFSSDVGGTYALLTAGRGGSITALPEVDVALREYEFHIPGIA